jgi:tetratricopeptide (TPR) repeat protein
MTKYINILLFLLITALSFGQNVSEQTQLAIKYFQDKEYEKAELLFEEIYKTTGAKFYFTYLINSLIEQKKYEDAEKQIKKEIRKNKNDLNLHIDLGYLYKRQDMTEEADKEYKIALKGISVDENEIKNVANTFLTRQEYEFAEKTYIEGKEKTGNNFNAELATVYAIQRKYPEMINKYLDLLVEDKKNIELVQNNMQYYMNNDIQDNFSEILRVELLKRIQKNSSEITNNQMLIWLFVQQKKFSQALIQAIAIDKRINDPGQKIIDLAKISTENKDYETAIKAYNYVIEKGRDRAFYIDAKTGKLDVLYMQATEVAINSPETIQNLENEFIQTINSLGIGPNTIGNIIKLAHLQAFYLNKPDEAEKLLNDAIKVKGLQPNLTAICKIELGDILLYKNDIWQAALIYGQAEKENENLPIGDEAKLRKAKLAYFANNFQWAKAQFDALKPSTSKPVSNDAIFYSNLIEENTKDDSTHIDLNKYADAEYKVFMNKDKRAQEILDSLITQSKSGNLIDEAYYLKAKIYEKSGDYENTIKYLQKIITEYSYDILADNAIFDLAKLYDNKLNDKESAVEYYKKLMIEHPESLFVAEARSLYRKIRENQ